MGELKRNEVLVFEDGTLTIKMSGHGRADGWGQLSFPERQVEIEDGYYSVEIAPSELRELRDFLTRVLQAPPVAAKAIMQNFDQAIDAIKRA